MDIFDVNRNPQLDIVCKPNFHQEAFLVEESLSLRKKHFSNSVCRGRTKVIIMKDVEVNRYTTVGVVCEIYLTVTVALSIISGKLRQD